MAGPRSTWMSGCFPFWGPQSHGITTKAPAETELVTHATKQCIKHLNSVEACLKCTTVVNSEFQAPCLLDRWFDG